jgi:hypothetical protein
MKRCLTGLVCAVALGLAVWSQGVRADQEATEAKGPNATVDVAKSDDASLATIRLAGSLAAWARVHEHPGALALAADILDSVPQKDLPKLPKQTRADGGPATDDAPAAHMTAQGMREGAKAMCGDDQAALAVLVALADMGATAKGRAGGCTRHRDLVQSRTTDIFRMRFRAREWAEIAVSGDGSSDVDLYIFDESGNLIASDTDRTDQCFVRWVPSWTGEFRIEVRNLGDDANSYTLYTN